MPAAPQTKWVDVVDPGLAAALERFERILADRFPDLLAEQGPGLDDAGIDRLREAVSPYLLPAQVEQLYRWRSGGRAGIFGGWYQNPAVLLPDRYRFRVDELGESPLWLPVFDAQIVNVVTLDLPGPAPSDPSVWYGHTHDGYLVRLFDSIERLVHTVCDVADAGRLDVDEAGSSSSLLLRDGIDLLMIDETYEAPGAEGQGWNRWRLARSPGAFSGTDQTPRGTATSRWPAPDWPQSWAQHPGRGMP